MRTISRRGLLGAAVGGAAGKATAMAASTYPIIDPHVHVWKRDPRIPFAKDAPLPPPDTDATPEMLLALMKANGVSKNVIIQVSHYLYDNRYAAEAIRRYPQVFTGVCRVDPEDPAAPDRLSHLCEVDRFQGVRLSPAVEPRGDWIRGPLMTPLWARCHQLGVPMTIQTKSPRMPDVGKLCEKFPDLTVVIDHMADTPPEEPRELDKLLALQRYPRVFVKISHTWWVSKQPYPYPDALAQVKKLYDRFGPRRLMWGTDWPIVEKYCGYARALAVVRDEMKFLSEEDRRWILGKTVEQVWKFGGGAANARETKAEP